MASFQISHHMLCLPQSHGRTAAFMALCNETAFQTHFMKTFQINYGLGNLGVFSKQMVHFIKFYLTSLSLPYLLDFPNL